MSRLTQFEIIRGLMKMAFATRAVLALVLTAASTLASAQVFQHEDRYYEVVPASGISWAQANAAASIRPHPAGLNIQGHLVTIHSSTEEAKIVENMPAPQGSRTEVWTAGTKGNCSVALQCFGRWNNGGLILGQGGGLILDHDNLDGPFSREVTVTPPTLGPYTNWQTGQPDNSDNAQTVAFGPGADGLFGLDDQKKTNAILGYIVEWGDSLTPHSGEACLAGCNLPEGNVAGSIYKFPANTVVAGKQVDVSSWVVQDVASRCGLPDGDFDGQVDLGEGTPMPVDLDGVVELDGSRKPEVILPGYTCAHPSVGEVVIFHTSSNVTPNGAVQVENFTSNLLPAAYQCNSRIPRNVPPTHQAIGLWQTDLVTDMSEKEATESTFACGSDRTRGGKGSYWVVGASINCGAADEYTCFLNVTLYKLHWALQDVQRAIDATVIASGDGSKMMNALQTSIADLGKGNITECRKHVLDFNKFARAAKYNTPASPINFSAQFEMRGENLLFTVDKLTAAKQFVAQ